MRILVLSPIPSHPQNQGNSARINVVCRLMQQLGHIVHFFYYPLEGLSPPQFKQMVSTWDYFHTIPYQLLTKDPSHLDYYGVDDWADQKVSHEVQALHAEWGFDMVWANYVWFSAALEALPQSVFKVIDTHDVFGGRHQKFLDIGLKPEWFFTSVQEERRGLQRANLVIAIQANEATYFENLLAEVDVDVCTLGHILPIQTLIRAPIKNKPVVGYIASGNPFNVEAIQRFDSELSKFPELVKEYDFVIAGTICLQKMRLVNFSMMGTVERLPNFYSQVDVVINPMKSGTGLKIKTLEALAYGVSFVGSASAFEGISIVKSNASFLGDGLLCALPSGSVALNQADSIKTVGAYMNTQHINLTNILERARTYGKEKIHGLR